MILANQGSVDKVVLNRRGATGVCEPLILRSPRLLLRRLQPADWVRSSRTARCRRSLGSSRGRRSARPTPPACWPIRPGSPRYLGDLAPAGADADRLGRGGRRLRYRLPSRRPQAGGVGHHHGPVFQPPWGSLGRRSGASWVMCSEPWASIEPRRWLTRRTGPPPACCDGPGSVTRPTTSNTCGSRGLGVAKMCLRSCGESGRHASPGTAAEAGLARLSGRLTFGYSGPRLAAGR